MYLPRMTSEEEAQTFPYPCQGDPWWRKAEALERVEEASWKKSVESEMV